MKKVLVVDDMPDIRKILKTFLERTYKCSVSEASDGDEALNIILKNETDLVITDLEMPNMTGFELAGFIRHCKKYMQLPIIMLTSRAEENIREKVLELKIDGFLEKPFNPAKMSEILCRFLEKN